MTKETIILIPVDGKNYQLTIQPLDEVWDWEKMVHVKCKEAGFDCEYPEADLPTLIQDIQYLIRDELAIAKDSQINIRVKAKDKVLLQQYASEGGYRSLSEYLLAKGLQAS